MRNIGSLASISYVHEIEGSLLVAPFDDRHVDSESFPHADNFGIQVCDKEQLESAAGAPEELCVDDLLDTPGIQISDGPPDFEDVAVTVAHFDFLPEDVSVSVDTEHLKNVEDAAINDGLEQDFGAESDGMASKSTSSESDDNDRAPDVDLMLALRRWNLECHNSRDSMGRLLSILRDAGHVDLPKDWRTVLSRCAYIDGVFADCMTEESASRKQPYDVLTIVCGACWLAPAFTDEQVMNAVTCQACGVSTVKCSRSLCGERCVLVTRLGKRCVDTLKPCAVCLISSTSHSTHRSYHWRLANYLRDAFADESQCLKMLFPFRDHFHRHVLSSGKPALLFKECWYRDWLHDVQSSPVSTQLFHGDRFTSNHVWTEHGPRSLVLLLSIDWFPPFKSRDYTVGVLTATVANQSTTDRADRRNTWILSILEGPKEPTHLFYTVAPVFLELRELEMKGLRIFDALTEDFVEVFVSVALVSADTPAAAKLGDHVGHGGYQPCISCMYIGSICGCKSKDGEEAPPTWENFNYKGGVRNPITGSRLRKKRQGEHICFVDRELLTRAHLRSDQKHRAGQLLMAKTHHKALPTKAALDRLRHLTKSNGVSPLCLLSSGILHAHEVTIIIVFENSNTSAL